MKKGNLEPLPSVNKLKPYIDAGYPLLWIRSFEENRVELEVRNTLSNCISPTTGEPKTFSYWSITEGLNVFAGYDKDVPVFAPQKNTEDPIEALLFIKNQVESSAPLIDVGDVFIFRDLHAFLEPHQSPKLKRILKDLVSFLKQFQKTIIILSPSEKIPLELQREITVIEFELPTKEEIEVLFDLCYTEDAVKTIGKLDQDTKEKILQASMGLTIAEAENAFAKAMVECNRDNTKISELVLEEKALTVKKSGILEYFKASTNFDDVGGLNELKTYIRKRGNAYSHEAKLRGLPNPKGMLIVGPPGTGKSLVAKSVARVLKVPLIRFDIGRVFGSLVGESEQNFRGALKQIEAIGSCVVWLDEAEKLLSGMGGNSGDGGTSTRILGTFLTWLQEKTSTVYVVATVNRINNLPAEFTRKGRFDISFFVDFPNELERPDIFDIHLKKYKYNINDFKKKDVEEWVKASKGYSGSEIEESIVTACFDAFDDGNRDLNSSDILNALESTTPLSESKAEEIQAMREYALSFAVPASSDSKTKTILKKSNSNGRVISM